MFTFRIDGPYVSQNASVANYARYLPALGSVDISQMALLRTDFAGVYRYLMFYIVVTFYFVP